MNLQNFTQNPEKYSGAVRRKDFYTQYLEKIASLGVQSVTELGMGSGDFLFHLPESITGIGIDKSQELVDVARSSRNKPNLSFRESDIITDSDFTPTDLVVMTGFMCTFLDLATPLDAAFKIARKHIFINDFANPHGLDCKYSFRERDQNDFQTVYNIWSLETIEAHLRERECQYTVEAYEMDTTLHKTNSPLYNYHATIDGSRCLVNDGGIILQGYNIYIELP